MKRAIVCKQKYLIDLNVQYLFISLFHFGTHIYCTILVVFNGLFIVPFCYTSVVFMYLLYMYHFGTLQWHIS